MKEEMERIDLLIELFNSNIKNEAIANFIRFMEESKFLLEKLTKNIADETVQDLQEEL